MTCLRGTGAICGRWRTLYAAKAAKARGKHATPDKSLKSVQDCCLCLAGVIYLSIFNVQAARVGAICLTGLVPLPVPRALHLHCTRRPDRARSATMPDETVDVLLFPRVLSRCTP